MTIDAAFYVGFEWGWSIGVIAGMLFCFILIRLMRRDKK